MLGTIKYFFLCRKFISKREVWTFVVHYLSLSRSTVVKGWLLRFVRYLIASPAVPRKLEKVNLKFVDSFAILKVLFNKWFRHHLCWRVSNPTTNVTNLIEFETHIMELYTFCIQVHSLFTGKHLRTSDSRHKGNLLLRQTGLQQWFSSESA